MEIKTAGVGGGNLLTAYAKGEGRGKLILSNPLDTDSEGAIKSVRNKGVSVLSGFRKNQEKILEKMLGVFSSQGQSKLFVIMRCPYYKRVSVERGLDALACSSISFLEIVEGAYHK